MYKYILESAGNIDWMAVFALLTFFIIFSLSAYLAFKKDKVELDRISALPLAEDDPITDSINQ